MAALSLVAAICAAVGIAAAPLKAPDNYVFFNRDRDRIHDRSFLDNPVIVGAQLKYTWRELEPQPGAYRFDEIRRDLTFLEAHGKRLYVQIQDVSFSGDIVNVPRYLLEDSAFGGGVARQYEDQGDDDATATPEGWVARRWDEAVRQRFVYLLKALGREFDGRLQGINLPETSIGFGTSGRFHPRGFTYEGYRAAVVATMGDAREAFPQSEVLQYANFMPGEWLPRNDHGYLRSIYRAAESLGVGVGGPDLLPFRKGQRKHSYPLIAARGAHTVAGVAVQDGNLEEIDPGTGRPVSVATLFRFASEDLHLDHLFWGTQEPFYSRDVLPFLESLASTGGGQDHDHSR